MSKPRCELPGHKAKDDPTPIGRYQVYDDELGVEPMPTMTAPALMCKACFDFAVKCGMNPRAES